MLWIGSDRLPIGDNSLVETTQFDEGHGPVAKRSRKMRPERERPVVPIDRLLMTIQQPQHVGSAVTDVGAAWIEGVHPHIVGKRLLEPLQVLQRVRAHEDRREMFGPLFRTYIETDERFLVALCLIEQE